MEVKLLFIICTSYLLLVEVLCSYEEEELPENWEDPNDMIGFDLGSRKSRGGQYFRKGESINGETGGKEDKSEKIKSEEPVKVEESQEAETKQPQQVEKDDNQPDVDAEKCSSPLLRRFASVFHRRLQNVGSPPNVEKFDVLVKLNSANWLSLQGYAEDCGKNAHDVVKILEDMISDINVHIPEKVSWKRKFEDFIKMPSSEFFKIFGAVLILVLILSLEYWSSVSWGSQFKRLAIVGIAISVGMTYFHEYKLAEAEFKSKSVHMPKECLEDFDELSHWTSIKVWFGDMFSVKDQNDRCKEYHEAFLVHPMVKVTPTKVLAVTMTRFAVEPMEHMGTAFSKAFKNIFAGLPVTLWIPAFVFVVLVILGFMLIIAVCFGYNFSFNLPFWAGLQMGPPAPVGPPPQAIQYDQEFERVRDENRRLQAEIQELRDRPQQQALPAPPAYPQAGMHQFDIGRGNERQDNSNAFTDFTNPPRYQQGPGDLPYPGMPPGPGFGGDAPRQPWDNRSKGLRRRHTCSEHFGGSGDIAPPYPATEPTVPETERNTRSVSDPNQLRRDIGFEHLMESFPEAESRTETYHTTHETFPKIATPGNTEVADSKKTAIEEVEKTAIEEVQKKAVEEIQKKDEPASENSLGKKDLNELNEETEAGEVDKSIKCALKTAETGTPTLLVENVGTKEQVNRSRKDDDSVQVAAPAQEAQSEESEDAPCQPSDESISLIKREAESGFSFDD